MAWVNDVCAVKDTKSLLKKPLGPEVKENERSVFFHTDYLQRILNRTVINTQNTSGSMSRFMAASQYFSCCYNSFLVCEIVACFLN